MNEQALDDLATAAVNGVLSLLEFSQKMTEKERGALTISTPVGEVEGEFQIQVSIVRNPENFIQQGDVRVIAPATIIQTEQ